MKKPTLSRRDLLQLSTVLAMPPANDVVSSLLQLKKKEGDASMEKGHQEPFSTKGLYMHAWDLRDDGADRVMGWMHDSGLKQMYIAGCYHSGWFIHPHSSRHRTYITEGSAAYFHPDEKLYKNTPLKPQLASFSKDTNWLKIAAERLEKHRLQMVSWTIGAHNTRLGQMYPECTQHNIYGEGIPHALSIGNDATREYLKALCRDLATNYPMWGIQLESFGWMDLRHGHHHERDLTGLTPLEQQLLSICFNPQTISKAKAEGVDVEKTIEAVKSTLDAAFREAPDRPNGHPASMNELEDRSSALKAYNRCLTRLADSLVLEIKQEALKGTSCKLLMQTGYQMEIALACDGFATWAYGKAPNEVLDIVKHGRAQIPANWQGEFPCLIRLGMGVPRDEMQLRDIVLALKKGGSTGPIFYNHSESPEKMLGWIKKAIEGL